METNKSNFTGEAISQDLIDACAAGDSTATDTICGILRPQLFVAASRFFPHENAECEDVVQDTLMAMLSYIKRQGGFSGNLPSFAVTIARNRCRDIMRWRRIKPHVPLRPLTDWIADPTQNPLGDLVEGERNELLQTVINRLSSDCRILLEAFYLKGLTIEQIRQRVGLQSVQGVYYRRSICLKMALRLFNRHLNRRSQQGQQ